MLTDRVIGSVRNDRAVESVRNIQVQMKSMRGRGQEEEAPGGDGAPHAGLPQQAELLGAALNDATPESQGNREADQVPAGCLPAEREKD